VYRGDSRDTGGRTSGIIELGHGSVTEKSAAALLAETTEEHSISDLGYSSSKQGEGGLGQGSTIAAQSLIGMGQVESSYKSNAFHN